MATDMVKGLNGRSLPLFSRIIMASVVLIASLFMCACTPKPVQTAPLTPAQQGMRAMAELKSNGVPVINRGNQIDILIPTQVIFRTGSSNHQFTAGPIIDDVTKVIKGVDVETVQVTGIAAPSSRPYQSLLTRSQAGTVGQALWRHGLKRDVPIVYGRLQPKNVPISDLSTQIKADLIWIRFTYYPHIRKFD